MLCYKEDIAPSKTVNASSYRGNSKGMKEGFFFLGNVFPHVAIVTFYTLH